MLNYKAISLAKYEFLVFPEEDLELPTYKGSTLRGAFGSIFKKISCLDKNNFFCKSCLLKDKCAYSYIFDTSPRYDSIYLRNLEDIPRPFIIEPPLDNRTKFNKNDSINFGLTLIGQAIAYVPYFIVAFKELGNEGIGKGKKKFKLKEIRAVSIRDKEKELIYSSYDQAIRNVDSRFTWDDILVNSCYTLGGKNSKAKQLTLNFLTPTRLKFRNEFVSLPEFHVVFRSLLRRIANLAHFHCGETLKIDFNSLIRKATKIKIEEADVHWVDWERYSFAQDVRMKLGGFIAQVTYKGDLEPFLPFLLLGEYVHVGKGATFGMGWYRIIVH